MSFLYPGALFGLISVPAIIIMYLFKQKFKELKVPSLYLWQSALSDSESQKPWQKLRKNILMILQIIIASLITLAIANPFIHAGIGFSSGIIILDASMSMQAGDEPGSRFHAAKKSAESRITSMKAEDEMSIIVMQKKPYIAIASSNDKKRLLEALDGIVTSNTAADFEQTLSLTESVNPERKSNIYFYSDDGNKDFGDMNVQKNIFGESADNLAITLLSHNFEDGKLICLAKIKNFGASPVNNELVVYADGVVYDIKAFSIQPMEELEILIPDLPPAAAEIEVKLSKPDLLEADDTAYLAINQSGVKKALLFTEQNIFLENMINILPDYELYKGAIDDMEDLSEYFLYIFDGVLPQNLPKDGHMLIFNPPEDNVLIPVGENISITNNTVKGTQGLSFADNISFSVSESKDIGLPDWSEDYAEMGGKLIMFSGGLENQKIMVIGFDLHNTDLPLKRDFPIFIYNIFQWFYSSQNLITESILAGDAAVFNILPNVESAFIVSPDNTESQIAPPFPASAFYDTDKPGIYLLRQHAGEETINTKFAVNVFNNNESNLLREEFTEDQNEEINNESGSNKYFRNILIFLALIFIAVEWWVYSRGI